MKQPKFLLMPPRILWLMLAVSAVLHWALGVSFPVGRSTPAGIAVIAFGVGINVWAARIFEGARTPIRPDATPTTIVESGPFRWSRNPMYAGLIALHLGVVVIIGDAVFWVSTGVYAAILRAFFIPHEERAMFEAFGESYSDYASRVLRWVGRRPARLQHQKLQANQGPTTSCR
jgi:protein-S-isoprenylcysteine O-methyltransferase Ste14